MFQKIPSKRTDFSYTLSMYNPYQTEENFFVATKCCFFFEGKLLVVSENRPWKPLWREFPGGKISKADASISLLESLRREVQEELSWDILLNEENTELFMVVKSYEATTFSTEPVPFLFLCYFHTLENIPEIQLSHEHSEVLWIEECEIESLPSWRWKFDTIAKKAFQTYNQN